MLASIFTQLILLKMKETKRPSDMVHVSTVMKALNLIKIRNADKTSGVTSDLLKVCKNGNKQEAGKVANNLLQEKKIPEIWSSDLKPVYKKKNVRL